MENKITIEQLLLNEATDIDIPSVGSFKVREPTRGDNLKSKIDASKAPNWSSLTQEEKNEEIVMHLIPIILVEPKMTYEQLNQFPQSKLTAIVEVISGFIYKKVQQLSDDREKLMADFFQVKTGKNP
jgi:hypothetical protein